MTGGGEDTLGGGLTTVTWRPDDQSSFLFLLSWFPESGLQTLNLLPGCLRGTSCLEPRPTAPPPLFRGVEWRWQTDQIRY